MYYDRSDVGILRRMRMSLERVLSELDRFSCRNPREFVECEWRLNVGG